MPTPFGIRRRLKALFGIAAPAEARQEIPKVQLTLVGPDGSEQVTEAFVGSTIVSAGTRFKRPLATGCSEASCGTCRVEVLEGAENLTEQTARERMTLKENNYPTTWRLGCKVELVAGAVKVRGFELM